MVRSRRCFESLLVVVSLAPGVASAQCEAGRWVTLVPMNEPRQELAAAQLDGKIYAVGGLAGRANANEIYDTAADRWSLRADLPTGTDHAWAVALDDRLYVGGGTTHRVFRYDPGDDTWAELAASVYVHGGTPAAAVIDGRIFVAGGAGGGMLGNEVEAYDPGADRWSILAPMECARNHTAGGVIGGKLYVAGGRPGNQSCVEAYDPSSNTWTRKTSMPTGRSGIAAAVVRDCLYVFGGEGNSADPNGIFHQVEAYDPTADAWRPLPPMQTGRHGIYAALLGNVIYLPGGSIRQGLGVTGTNEAYVLDGPGNTSRLPVSTRGPRPRATPRPIPRR